MMLQDELNEDEASDECTTCNGTGSLIDGYSHGGEPKVIECDTCEGSGKR